MRTNVKVTRIQYVWLRGHFNCLSQILRKGYKGCATTTGKGFEAATFPGASSVAKDWEGRSSKMALFYSEYEFRCPNFYFYSVEKRETNPPSEASRRSPHQISWSRTSLFTKILGKKELIFSRCRSRSSRINQIPEQADIALRFFPTRLALELRSLSKWVEGFLHVATPIPSSIFFFLFLTPKVLFPLFALRYYYYYFFLNLRSLPYLIIVIISVISTTFSLYVLLLF